MKTEVAGEAQLVYEICEKLRIGFKRQEVFLVEHVESNWSGQG